MSRHKLLATSRTKPPANIFADLVTRSENTLADSSQATVITRHSQASLNTQSYDSWNDLQNFDDYIRESNDTLRISPEEEKRIQSILQLARKGKINPGNAFDIPIKVVDSQLGEDENMRFWKFSSELLSASMGIYDKRVEHVYQGTNRMFDSLVRHASNTTGSVDEEPEEKSRRQRGAILKMDLSQLGTTDAIASYDFAKQNCDQPEKVSVKKHLSYQKTDPMFNKRLQAFDSDSLKSLFLNVFETGSNAQVKFFNDERSHLTFTQNQALDKSFSQNDQLWLDQEQVIHQTGHFPRFIKEDVKKTNFLAQNNQTFSLMSQFFRQNNRQQLVEGKIQVEDFDFDLTMNHRENSFDQGDGLIENKVQFEDSHFSMPQADITQLSQLSEDPYDKAYDEDTTVYPMSQQFSRPQLFMSQTFMDSSQDLTPWQLEFKGLKLQKKRTKRDNKKGSKKQNNKDPDEFQINFLDKQKISRKNILKMTNDSPPVQTKKKDQYLLAKIIDPFHRLFAHIRPAQTQSKSDRRQSGFLGGISNNFQTQALDVEHMSPGVNGQQDMDLIPFVSAGKSSQKGFSSQDQYYLSSQGPLKNIRDIKERLWHFVQQKGHILLSEIDIGLTYSSIMVVILHLANQLKVELEETDTDDVIIKAIH